MHGRFSRIPAMLFPVCAAILVASCDTGSPAGPRIVSLVEVSGNDQAAPVGAALPEALTVQAVDQNGVPVPGVPLDWQVVTGNGTLVAASSVTDATGFGQAIYELGNVLGAQRVSVKVGSQNPITFRMTATTAAASVLRIASGNNQNGFVASPLKNPLVVEVTDAVGNPKPGVLVNFIVASGGGTVSASSVASDAQGRASVNWTLGPNEGAQAVTVTSAGLPPVIFTTNASELRLASISAGGRHACGVSTDNVLYCWGFNGDGQLGLGSSAAGSGAIFASPQPAEVSAALSFTAVTSGSFHTCGWTLSYNPYCWGKNVDGRVGDGSTSQVNEPTHVSGSQVYRALTAGGTHTCGITLADRLFCWGSASEGQVGDSLSLGLTPVSDPIEVNGGLRFSQVSSGGLHTCAITLFSETYCWGLNLRGELGDGTTADRASPTLVAGAPPFARIASGADHTCALAPSGEAYCWGDNTYGQLGDGSTATGLAPVPVGGGLTFQAISAGMHHTCAISGGSPPVAGSSPAPGAVYCWGRNREGQLGDGSLIDQFSPTMISGTMTFGQISAGDLASCGLSSDRIAYCWGDNQYGQIGDGTQARRTAPARVVFQP